MFEIKKVMEHYNLYFNGEFIGSADSYAEIDELKKEWKSPLNPNEYVNF